MFKRESGDFNILPLTNAISTLYYNGGLIYPNGSGAFIPADSTSGNHVGIAQEDITATDARYTTAGKINVDILRSGDLVRATDITGTLTAAMEGTFLDLSNSLVVNAAASSKSVVFCVKYISASEGIFMVNSLAAHANVATT